ncbi:MAG: hotdog domain-containing protein [Psychrobacter sp.]|nr:hotdog domain-containing protein [Psychrobacter sp.]
MSSAPIFYHPYQTYIHHTDASGIVYHGNYLSFYEHCRRDWFADLGLNGYFFTGPSHQIPRHDLTHDAVNDKSNSSHLHHHSEPEALRHFVVADAHLKYMEPILLDSQIIVTIDQVEVRPASLIFYQSLYSVAGMDQSTDRTLGPSANQSHDNSQAATPDIVQDIAHDMVKPKRNSIADYYIAKNQQSPKLFESLVSTKLSQAKIIIACVKHDQLIIDESHSTLKVRPTRLPHRIKQTLLSALETHKINHAL